MVQIFESKKGTHARILNDIGNCGDDVRAAIGRMLGVSVEAAKVQKPKNDLEGISLIGTDESGKGDYFGPLVVAGVYLPAESLEDMEKIGVRDSKKLTDKRARTLAEYIESKFETEIVVLMPQRYNEMHTRIGNVNNMLGWAHARVIENLLERVDCKRALTDQFGNRSFVERELMERGRNIVLDQMPRAEAIPAVAAASIVARARFLDELEALSSKCGTTLPKGASSRVDAIGREFVKSFGIEELANVAKFHFKNTSRIV